MNSLYDITCVTLQDNSEIRLNDQQLSIEKWLDGKMISEFTLGCPSRGYAGGSIHVSLSETYLLFAYYSGQSEEAFALFRHDDEIRLLYDSNYQYGEAASYCFSEDENLLIQAMPDYCDQWWLQWEHDDLETDTDGHSFFNFGSINCFDIVRGTLAHHDVRIYPETGWKPDEAEYDPFLLSPTALNSDVLTINWPWGEDTLSMPLDETIAINLAAKA